MNVTLVSAGVVVPSSECKKALTFTIAPTLRSKLSALLFTSSAVFLDLLYLPPGELCVSGRVRKTRVTGKVFVEVLSVFLKL